MRTRSRTRDHPRPTRTRPQVRRSHEPSMRHLRRTRLPHMLRKSIQSVRLSTAGDERGQHLDHQARPVRPPFLLSLLCAVVHRVRSGIRCRSKSSIRSCRTASPSSEEQGTGCTRSCASIVTKRMKSRRIRMFIALWCALVRMDVAR